CPNAGMPINEDGKAVYKLEPDKMALQLVDFAKDFGVNIIGGCCGTSPKHIKKIAELISSIPIKNRQIIKPFYVSSGMKSVSLEQNPKPLIVGERINSQGSRKVKELLLAEDYNSLVNIAREQVERGAHVLDICVALTERDNESETMKTVVKKLSMTVDAPLMVDSTDYNVIETALKNYPGTAIINSINLENGRERIDHILPLAKAYGAAVVALTIDEKGMAKTKDRKLDIAKRIYDIYTKEYMLEPTSIIFDLLTFTLATGEEEWKNSAIDTLKAIKEIKIKYPGVLTVLGVSNVSFGLKPNSRKILNSVFLYHAVQEGLDLAIVNPNDIIPYPSIPQNERELAENLIYNRSADALMVLSSYFEKKQGTTQEETLIKEENILPVEEALHHKILHRITDGLEELLDEAMEKYAPVEILNNILLNAMKEVGDKFGSGELILPFVLQSAEVMKRAVTYLEKFFERKEGSSKGVVLLATVYGDVHDIGKNLVKTILSNNGYTVHDLGKQVPVNTIIEKATELKVSAIGLSALLVSTSKQMGICVEELHKKKLDYPVLIGGAAINRDYSRRIALVDENSTYIGGVFYAKDAFEGLDIMESLSKKDKRELFINNIRDESIKFAKNENISNKTKEIKDEIIHKSSVKQLTKIPTPPFWGSKTLKENDISLNEVFSHLAISELFRLSWGGRGKSKEEYKKLIDNEFSPILEKLKIEVSKKQIFSPKITYGYFPCQSDGNSLILFDPNNHSKEISSFLFPRQSKAPYLCLADYFISVNNEIKDVIALQVVTIGDQATKVCDELNDKGNYTDSYYLHGLAVQTAEAMAEYNHQRILKELNIPSEQGKRYSFGYPACPELNEQAKFMTLLPVEKEIGVILTDAFQLVPEQSTSAIIIHHPDAEYYRI
ncbi:MAG: dihydropteroate synthase, partial [Spirochaetota bacterium]|nr:dihydropteroate synthase [Spirochaetota bacterium]